MFSKDSNSNKMKYRGRNFKGALTNGLSNITYKSLRNKPIGIFNTHSNSNSLTMTDLKSFTNSSRPHSHSFYNKRNNSPINCDNIKRNKTFRQSTINTIASTSETDKQQDTFENISCEKNVRKLFRTQLSKISENPKNKTYTEKTINEINYNENNNINNNFINNNNDDNNIYKIQGEDNLTYTDYKKKRSRNSLFINSVLFNKTMKPRLLSGKPINNNRNSIKKLTINSKFLNNNDDNYPSDCGGEMKKVRLRELCKNLIERNQLIQKEIQEQKLKFISKFNIISKDYEIKLNKIKGNIIENYTKKKKKIIIKKLQKRNISKYNISINQYKKNILISPKVIKRELLVINYFNKVIRRKKNVFKNIVFFRYATQLSENYFPLNLSPKNLNIMIEKESHSKLIDNFSIFKKKDSKQVRYSFSKSPFFILKKLNRYSSIISNVIKLNENSIKFINTFLIKDFYDKKTKANKKVSFQIDFIKKLIIPKQNTRKKSLKRKTFRKTSNLNTKYDFLNKHNNNTSPKNSNLTKIDKTIFQNCFYNRTRFKETILKRKSIEMVPISSTSLSAEMKKNNIYLFTDSLINNKEHTLLRTIEIKTVFESKLNDELEKLIYSIKDLNFPLFKRIFEQYSVSPNLHDQKGNTLLSLAVQSNCFQIINFLLNIGADPNICNVKYIFFNF